MLPRQRTACGHDHGVIRPEARRVARDCGDDPGGDRVHGCAIGCVLDVQAIIGPAQHVHVPGVERERVAAPRRLLPLSGIRARLRSSQDGIDVPDRVVVREHSAGQVLRPAVGSEVTCRVKIASDGS